MSTDSLSTDTLSFPDAGDDDKLEQDLKEAQDQPGTKPQPPEKYKGKSIEDVIAMHQNVESELGRARNEIGTVRRLADELLGIRQSAGVVRSPTPEPRKKLTTDALFEDPDKAILDVVRSDAEARDRQRDERTARLEAEVLLTRFERKHPKFQETMQSPEFTDWIQKSPYRARLAQNAAQGDFLAADELFSLHNELTAEAAKPAVKNSGVEGARKASLARAGGSTAGGGGSSDSGKKIWSRVELIRMRIEEPEKFDSLYEKEILPAYKEKRVK